MKGNTEDEIESKLESLKGLIFLLNSRDAFLKIYTKQLSSRLLNGTTVSNDAEKSMYNLMQVKILDCKCDIQGRMGSNDSYENKINVARYGDEQGNE
jgi:Cullin, a subunit of E3 ubiquitin ligase